MLPSNIEVPWHYLTWANSVFTPEQLKGVLASTSICFDLSVYEMFAPLSCGGSIILVENILHLPDAPAANEVTLINTVPSAITELLRIKGVPDSVRTVNLAGEPLKTSLVDQIYEIGIISKKFLIYTDRAKIRLIQLSLCAIKDKQQSDDRFLTRKPTF